MINIVLVQPRIPQNVGSIGRMCYNIGFSLYIVKPLVFDINEKSLKRAGLDYWPKLNPFIYESLEEFLKVFKSKDRFFFCSTKANKLYYEASFKKNDFLFFGSESFGLPKELLYPLSSNAIKIPMQECGRSYNLATSVGIISFEALRQINKAL